MPESLGYYVLDDPLPGAAVRGTTVVLSRGLLESESLAAVLAHELGHVGSLDGRLTEALGRLALWGDPLAPVRPERGGEGRAEFAEDRRGALTWGLMRWSLRLAGGSFAQGLLSPLWAAYWRWREYAADAYAASLGQAEDLARHLSDHEQPFDAPQPGLLFKAANHPPVAHRIERLREHSLGAGRNERLRRLPDPHRRHPQRRPPRPQRSRPKRGQLVLAPSGGPLSAVTCSVLGAALLAECIAAVSHGNPGCSMCELPGSWPMPSPEQYEFTDFGPCASVAEACKAIDCFEYQSCEHPEWAQGVARRFCDRLRRALLATLAGREEAPWEWTPEILAARGLIASAVAFYVSGGGERGR